VPSRAAARRNATAYRQQQAATAANQGRPLPYGYARGSHIQVARPEPVVLEPQKAVAGAPRVLIAEFLVCIVMVAAKPFEKTGEGAKMSDGTIGQFAAIMVLFFLLALFGGVSARTQKAANLFGALVTLGLIFKNTETIAAVASAVSGSVKNPAGAAGAAGGQPGGILPTPTGTQPILGEVPG
jgi:hypothetical protein